MNERLWLQSHMTHNDRRCVMYLSVYTLGYSAHLLLASSCWPKTTTTTTNKVLSSLLRRLFVWMDPNRM